MELIPPFEFETFLTAPWAGGWESSLWIVVMGFLVNAACGLVGNFLILRRMALVGDKTTWGKDDKKSVAPDKLITAAEYQKLFRLDQWNDVIIRAKGSKLQHYMNGRLVMECVDEHSTRSLPEGILAFQLHAGRPMWVEFKNVRFKELK